jgi:hypothetical protein
VRGPVRPVRELIPPKLASLPGAEAVARRFASDVALLARELRPAGMPSSERAVRVWTFFQAYAVAAASHGPHAEAAEVFLQALQERGLAGHREAGTGKDVLALARWVLAAPTPREARDRAETVHLEPPPEVLHSEAAAPTHEAPAPAEAPPPRTAARELRDSTFTAPSDGTHPERPRAERAEGHTEFVRPEVPRGGDSLRPLPPALERRGEVDAQVAGERTSGSNRRLGAHMLWNVLHRFRDDPEDSAVAREQWERLSFGALLALVGLALVGAVLLSL